VDLLIIYWLTAADDQKKFSNTGKIFKLPPVRQIQQVVNDSRMLFEI